WQLRAIWGETLDIALTAGKVALAIREKPRPAGGAALPDVERWPAGCLPARHCGPHGPIAAMMSPMPDTTVPPAPVAPPAAEAAIDRAHLDRQTFCDRALQAEVLGLFRDELPNAHARLETASSARDWHFAAHALKGSARAVGAVRLAALALAAEQAAARPGARDALIGDIGAEIERVHAEVRALLDELGAGPGA